MYTETFAQKDEWKHTLSPCIPLFISLMSLCQHVCLKHLTPQQKFPLYMSIDFIFVTNMCHACKMMYHLLGDE